MEETQEQTKKNEARIKEVDTAVQSPRQTAEQANQAASEAATLARTVATQTEAIENASRRLAYEVVLSEGDVTFGFGQTDLSDSAKEVLNGQWRN